VALTDRGELGAVRRRVCPQLDRAQPVLVPGGRQQAAPAGGQRGGGRAAGLRAQGLGEPTGRVAERGAAAAEPRRAGQMAIGVVEPAVGRGQAPGQQVRGGRLLGAERVEAVGDPAGLRPQPAVAHAGVVPRLHQHERRASPPPLPALGAEQVAGGRGPVGGDPRPARGLGGPGGGEQQLGPLRRLTGVLLDPGVRLGERFPREAGGQQHLAPVEDQVGRVDPERGVPLGGPVEKAERRRQVAGLHGDVGPVVHRHRRLQLLPGLGVQAFRDREVAVGPAGVAERGVHQEAVGARPGLPYAVAGSVQRPDRAVEVGETLVMAAEEREQGASAHQHPRADHTGRAGHGCVERGQTGAGAPAVDECDAQRGQDVELTRLLAGRPCEAHRAPQLDDGLAGAAAVAQDDAARLTGNGCGERVRPSAQHPVGRDQCLGRPGDGQPQQVVTGRHPHSLE
jgi:hypothetical protein